MKYRYDGNTYTLDQLQRRVEGEVVDLPAETFEGGAFDFQIWFDDALAAHVVEEV